MSGVRVKKAGPRGSNGGAAFEAISRLTRIKIHHLNAVRALEFQHEINGVLQWSPLLGVPKDSQISEIVLEKGEYLSSISGHTGSFEGYYVVTSLTLISNIRKYGPFGKETGRSFNLRQEGGLLDSIGAYLQAYAKDREELSKKLAQVTAENNSLKDEVKNHIKEREELDKKVNQLEMENSTLKIEAGKHTKVGLVPKVKDTGEDSRNVSRVYNIDRPNTTLREGGEPGIRYGPDTVNNIHHANTTLDVPRERRTGNSGRSSIRCVNKIQ